MFVPELAGFQVLGQFSKQVRPGVADHRHSTHKAYLKDVNS